MKLIVFLIINAQILILINCDDNTIFFYNDFNSCKSNEYFNVDYLKCQICDNNLYLIPHSNSE